MTLMPCLSYFLPLLSVENLLINFFCLLIRIQVWRASVAELLGSAVLVFVMDAIVISTFETDDIKAPNLVMSILIAITFTIICLSILPVSGGHINPVISFSASLVGLISLSRFVVYVFAQCVGSVLGALALKAVISSSIARDYSLGGCTITVIAPGPNGQVTTGIGAGQAFALEVICTFVLLFITVWTAFDQRQAKKLGPVLVLSIIGTVIGLLTFVSTTLTTKRGYAGAGMNPARCFGPMIVRGGHLWDDNWIFWVGPALASFAFYFYTKIIPKDHFHAEDYKHDFFGVLKALKDSTPTKG